MKIPLSLFDYSIWLTFNTLLILITSEVIILIPYEYGINKKMLNRIGLSLGLLFMIIVILRIMLYSRLFNFY